MKNNQPKYLVIEPTWLGILLGSRKAFLVIGKAQTKIMHKNKKITIKHHDFHDRLVFKKGVFFSKIIITSPKETTHHIKWLKARTLTKAHEFAVDSFYEELSKPLLLFTTKIKEHLKNNYPRELFWEGILKSSQLWQSIFRSLPSPNSLSSEQFSAFKYTDDIAKGVINCNQLQRSYVERQLLNYKKYFDGVESNPLTEKQRLACVVDEENNLVLAGAGSGKTSVMIGRAGFLIKSKQATPKEILLLAFANKAAGEMSERISTKLNIEDITASTFHSLGQHIIAEVENGKPSVSVMATDTKAYNDFIASSFEKLMKQDDYKKIVIKHFLYFSFEPIDPFSFSNLSEYNSAIKDNDLRTINDELVKGYQELLIANFLYKSGINYRYEAKYKVSTRTIKYRQYQPDFYLPDYGIYIEHYGIDREGNTAEYINKAKYNEGIEWKRETHKTNNTTCIETFHYDWVEDKLLERLSKKLKEHNVIFTPLRDDQILLGLKKNDHNEITSPIRELSDLLGKMLKLFKASNLDISIFSDTVTEQNTTIILQKVFDKILNVVSEKYQNNNNLVRLKSAQKLLMPLFGLYQDHLIENQEIDFDDMINKAIQYVQNGNFIPPWKYIMVDEFQDISSSRATLIKELRDKSKDCSIFCVGDDWQAIYRFAGSDLTFVTEFEKKFGTTQTTTLDKTFRFNNSISEVASSFVTRNPDQVEKDITTDHHVNRPAVSLLRADNRKEEKQLKNIEQVLSAISSLRDESSVLILGRFSFTLPERKELSRIEKSLGNIQVKTMTIHGSKGKEADFVILLGLEDGKFGFPSEKKDHPLIDALLPKAQQYLFAEERRLFYVAITRAKERTYLVVDMKNPSRFIVELINEKYPIELDEFEVSGSQLVYQQVHCFECEIGSMIPRIGMSGNFYGCSCYPRCSHSENGCKECGSVMLRDGQYKLCTNKNCKGWIPLCPECGEELEHKNGRYGQFWGCRNYRHQGVSCNYTQNEVYPPDQTQKTKELVY